MGRGLSCGTQYGSVGRVGDNRVTDAASARLLRLFVRRLVRHHGFEALLLWSVGGRSQRSDEKDTVRNVSSKRRRRWAVAAQQLACAVPFLTGATGSFFTAGTFIVASRTPFFTAGTFINASRTPCPCEEREGKGQGESRR